MDDSQPPVPPDYTDTVCSWDNKLFQTPEHNKKVISYSNSERKVGDVPIKGPTPSNNLPRMITME